MNKKVLLLSLVHLALAFSVQLEDVFPSVNIFRPVEMTTDGISDGLYILSQPGIIYKLEDIHSMDPTVSVFLNITDRVFGGSGEADERGILGAAFSPTFRESREFYVFYTGGPGDIFTFMTSHVSKFTVDSDGVGLADSEEKILSVDHPFPNHNGGEIKFGPDDFLYIALGDGGNAGDPYSNGQDLGTLLGKMLRIDVLNIREESVTVENGTILSSRELDRICRDVSCTTRRGQYSIPLDNPFATGDGLFVMPEIWAYGLRNPWKFSFDNDSGLIFASDAGQDLYEEIDVLFSGVNYGWNIKEGPFCFLPREDCLERRHAGMLEDPIYWYNHTDFDPSLDSVVVGGYVYRGSEVPDLFGKYLFGDNVRGFISALVFPNISMPHDNSVEDIVTSNFFVSSFGEDMNKELYALEYRQGKIYKFVASARNMTTTTTGHQVMNETTHFDVVPFGFVAWTINGVNNPPLNLTRGNTYTFRVEASELHPFWIKTERHVLGTASGFQSDGLSANGVTSPTTITWHVLSDTPDQLFYQCANHLPMEGPIFIQD